MKKTVRILSIVLVLVAALSLAACGKKEVVVEQTVGGGSSEDLLGTWKGIGDEISTVSFTKSGVYRDDAGDGLYVNGTYTVDESACTITVNESDYGMVFVYDYTVADDKLTLQLSGGKARNFVRKK